MKKNNLFLIIILLFANHYFFAQDFLLDMMRSKGNYAKMQQNFTDSLYGAWNKVILNAPPFEYKVDSISMFETVDERPQFPAGMVDLIKYFQKSMPKSDSINQYKGVVITKFFLDESGFAQMPKIAYSECAICDSFALQMIRDMPKWNPGKQYDLYVNTLMTLPIQFGLDYINYNVKGAYKAPLDDNIQPIENEIFDRAEVMPKYLGGTTAMMDFINSNLQYPKSAYDKKAEGKVIVRFYIDRDGSIMDAKVLKDEVGNGCSTEALRIVNLMPKWIPGEQRGNKVKVYYALPITFKINTNKVVVPTKTTTPNTVKNTTTKQPIKTEIKPKPATTKTTIKK